MKDRKQLIEEAKGYPLDVPKWSYILINNETLQVVVFNHNQIKDSIIQQEDQQKITLNNYLEKHSIQFDNGKRIPVIGYGANASNIQLMSKYKDYNNNVIPVIKATLSDFDVVYTPYFCYDGAIPSTIQHVKGVESTVYITYLTEEQLEIMHKTECVGEDYSFIKLNNIELTDEFGLTLNHAYCYISLHGCLQYNHSEVALTAIEAKNRKVKSMTEEEVLSLAKNILNVESTLDDFIIENIVNKELRIERSKLIQTEAIPFGFNEWQRVK